MKTNFLLSILVALAFWLVNCAGPKAPEATDSPADTSGIVRLTQAQQQAIHLQTGSFQRAKMSVKVQANGILDVPPQNLITLTSRVAGFVKSTRLLQGLHVHKGEELLVLENPEFIQWQETWLSNHSRLRFLEKEWERQEALAGQQAASQKMAQQSESEYKSLKAMQLGLEAKLKMYGFSLDEIRKGNLKTELAVRATSDGYITSVQVNLGQFVQSGAALADLVDRSHLHVELLVYEQDLPRIAEGQLVRFVVHGLDSDTLTGKVFLINPKINSDRTVQVHVHIESNTGKLVPNMQVQAWIETGNAERWAVPETAVVTIGQNQGIFRELGKGEYRFEVFQPGIKGSGLIEWKGALSAEQQSWRVVIKGAFELMSVAENKDEGE